MPKAQKKTSTKARADPLAKGDANASKKPNQSTDTAPKPSKNATQSKAKSPTNTTDSSESNYLILVRLNTSYDPTITRLLSLPPSLTFDKVHRVLQVVFGWANSHMHQFEVTLSSDEDQGPMGGPPPVLYINSSRDNDCLVGGEDENVYE